MLNRRCSRQRLKLIREQNLQSRYSKSSLCSFRTIHLTTSGGGGSVVDPICCWTCLCHWAGEDLPLLFPETQDEGHQFLPWRCVCGADWLAHHWSRAGDLWLFSLVQVRAEMGAFNI